MPVRRDNLNEFAMEANEASRLFHELSSAARRADRMILERAKKFDAAQLSNEEVWAIGELPPTRPIRIQWEVIKEIVKAAVKIRRVNGLEEPPIPMSEVGDYYDVSLRNIIIDKSELVAPDPTP